MGVLHAHLCVHAQHVTFNLGRRIGGKDQRWDFRDPQLVEKIVLSIKGDAYPLLGSIQSPNHAYPVNAYTH